ncbi:MAG: N-acetylmuramoyl-L-alanine amidase [Prevotella sp.]|nr:N-acetylmuramoyl-L-alanine amidase [Prevotella sp.]
MVLAMTAVHAASRFTLVIDAGHGGTDHGAPGAYSSEKDLTLKYALAFGRMVERNCSDVRVVYTRTTDIFIPLYQRAEIANRNKADLFISIHINALDGIHTAHGFQSYTLGRGERTGDKGIRENLDVAKRENSVIYLEKDYRTVYKGFDANSAESDIMFEFIADKNRERSVELSRLMQREVCRATGRQDGGSHQNNLAVLRLTSMPATLLELGFISTPDEEDFLNSDEALNLYAKGIYNAFITYKNKYEGNISVPYRENETNQTRNAMPLTPVKLNNPSSNRREMSAEQKASDANAESEQPAKVLKKKTIVAPSGKVDEGKPVFKIQIFTSTSALKTDDHHFKGLENCSFYEDGAHKKYTFGASNNYNEIYRLRKQILDKFPECFIIAFKNGKKMDVNEGIREFKANR